MSQRANTIQINLLSERKHRVRKRRALMTKVQLISGIILAVYIAILLVVAGVRTAVAVQLNRLEDDIQEAEKKLAQLTPIETLYTLMVNKYNLFDEVYYNRVKAQATLENVAELLPEGVTFDGVAFGDGDSGVTVSFEAYSLPEAVALLNIFESVVAEDVYDKVVVSQFSRNENGTYAFGVTIFGIEEKA